MKKSISKDLNPRPLIVGLVAGTVLFLVGCHSDVAQDQDMPARKAIASATSEFETAFAQTNSVGIASQYMRDAELLLASEQAIRDRDAIAEFFDNFFLHTGASKIQFKAARFQQVGSFANETGAFVTSTAEGKTVLGGDYIAIWRLVGAEWKLQVHAFNPSREQNDRRDVGGNGPHGLVRL